MKVIKTAKYIRQAQFGSPGASTYSMGIEGSRLGLPDEEVILDIEYTISPGEKADRDYPGSAPEVEVLSIKRDDTKQDITELVLSRIPNFYDEIESNLLAHSDEEAQGLADAAGDDAFDRSRDEPARPFGGGDPFEDSGGQVF